MSNYSIFKQIGGNGHCDSKRTKDDFYATNPIATEWLCRLEQFNNRILEPCCGMGHISEVLKAHGYDVTSRDVVDRGYGDVADFLSIDTMEWNGDIVTNPPFSYAHEFVEKALSIIPNGNKVAMFLKIQFLEGKARRELFRIAPPRTVYVSSSRIACWPDGDPNKQVGSAFCYAWFVWEKGFKGDPIIKWFN